MWNSSNVLFVIWSMCSQLLYVKMPRTFPQPQEEEVHDDNGEGPAEYDYDLFVIGAGSGGVRASRTAASFGAKVCNRKFCNCSTSYLSYFFSPFFQIHMHFKSRDGVFLMLVCDPMIRLVSANCHTVLSARKQLEALAARMAIFRPSYISCSC